MSGFDVLQDHFNRLVPVQDRVTLDLETRELTHQAYLHMEFEEMKNIMVLAVAAAQPADFVVLEELNEVAQDYVAQGRTKTDRPMLSELLDVGADVGDRKAVNFVLSAVRTDDVSIRPNMRAAMEIFGLVAPALLALSLGLELGALFGVAFVMVVRHFLKIEGGKNRELLPVDAFYDAVQGAAHYPVLNTWFKDEHMANHVPGTWPFSDQVTTRRQVREQYYRLMQHMSKHKVLHLTGEEAAQFKEETAKRKDELIDNALAEPRRQGPKLTRELLESIINRQIVYDDEKQTV